MRSESRIAIAGAGAVSASGWGLNSLFDVYQGAVKKPSLEMLEREGRSRSFPVLRVPRPEQKLPFTRHPRMRRASAIGKYALAAALEALGEDRISAVESGELKLGVILCLMNGCVNFSNRFYSEVLADPSTASPILFPETVFNAPSSHLSAFLGSREINYTLVGDTAEFLAGVDLAAAWLNEGVVEGCLVVGAEELDWLSTEGLNLFSRGAVASEGAGALYLEPVADNAGAPPVELERVTDPVTFLEARGRTEALKEVAKNLDLQGDDLLFMLPRQFSSMLADDLKLGAKRDLYDLEEINGQSMGASLALQAALGFQVLREKVASKVVVLAPGHNQQCCGAIFRRNG